jgi:hypothetical protein
MGIKSNNLAVLQAVVENLRLIISNSSSKMHFAAFIRVGDKVDFHSPNKILQIGEKP